MANKTKDEKIPNTAEFLSGDTFLPSVLSEPTTETNQANKRDLPNDDLIVSLSDARENRRARQVFEWETIRRNSIQSAA